MEIDAPEYLLISEAVSRLEAGMFGGGITRPRSVALAKRNNPGVSIGSDLHRQNAAEKVDAAIRSGALSVCVFPSPHHDARSHDPLTVPINVLRHLVRSRGGLPDRVARLPIHLLNSRLATPELFSVLSQSALHLRCDEFDLWYKQQRSRGRWPSQRTSRKPRVGRPSKQTEALRNSIVARVEEKRWTGQQGIAPLLRLLASRPPVDRETLRRTVERIYLETGDVRYRVIRRRRTKPALRS